MPITLQVNGKPLKLEVEPRVTLLDALRNQSSFTGAKEVCDRATCGACTVLVDDKPVYSCSMLAIEAQGKAITTVEGLAPDGKLTKVQEAQSGMDKAEANALQVRVELQADCLAGVWANRAQAKWQFIEPGDVDALQTASAIGDDRLQRRTQGYVVPDAFTHGTSAQRGRWFMTGLKSGAVGSCDTFRAEQI